MYCEKLVLERSPWAAEKSSAGAVALFLLPWAGSAGCKGGRERGKETLNSGALIKLISSVPRTPRAGGLTKSSTQCTNTIISLTIARATGKSLGQSRPTRNFENERPFTMPCHPLSASAPSANDRQGFSETSTRRLRSMDARAMRNKASAAAGLSNHVLWKPSRQRVRTIGARRANLPGSVCEPLARAVRKSGATAAGRAKHVLWKPSRQRVRTIGARCANHPGKVCEPLARAVRTIPARFANHWRAPCEPSRRPL